MREQSTSFHRRFVSDLFGVLLFWDSEEASCAECAMMIFNGMIDLFHQPPRAVGRALGDSDPSEGVARNDTGAIVSVVRAASVIYLNGTFSLFFFFSS